ncbi:MAG: DUF3769 domain-containing protein [Aphanocapsa sp. GSE-SYN-MK-11-07L]|nr:DUF3769 domain-containing protein [Aphanocapsa sp. GSE-SYN-MK-11-07L]
MNQPTPSSMPFPLVPPAAPPPLVQTVPVQGSAAIPAQSTPSAVKAELPIAPEALPEQSPADLLGAPVEANPSSFGWPARGNSDNPEASPQPVVLTAPIWSEIPAQSEFDGLTHYARPAIAQIQPATPASPEPASPDPSQSVPLETTADRQEFDNVRQVFTAVGDVLMNFRQSELKADRVQTDVVTQIVVAEGNVTLTRGGQVLQGGRLEYNLVQDRGTFFQTRGSINLPQAGQDFSGDRPGSITGAPSQLIPFSQQLGDAQPQPLQTGAGDAGGVEGELRRLRFEADRIEFDGGRYKAFNVRVTNDPFSPPELELRSTEASLERISPLEDKLTLRRGRIVFDQKVAVPLLREEVIISRRQRNILPFDFGYDSDFGGLFIGRTFDLLSSDRTSFVVTPLFLVQRAINENFNLVDGDLYGGTFRFNSQLTDQTSLGIYAKLTSLDPNTLSDTARANLRLQRSIGSNQLIFQSSFRERLFNGSLGEQDVRSTVGLLFLSPNIPLGSSGLNLTYQVGAQYVTADTFRDNLINRESLGRFQGTVNIGRGFTLWQGKALPPTQTEGLRYTPTPVTPYVQLFTGIQGVSTGYTSGDTQQAIIGAIGIQGQIGQFSKPMWDYTGFNVSFYQAFNSGVSPFLFDRIVDFQVVTLSFLQQIYGPVRAGVQGSLNVQTGALYDTNIIVEYSRRTYGVVFRYSPDREIGSFVLRINGFNLQGNTDPLAAPDVNSVRGGVISPR